MQIKITIQLMIIVAACLIGILFVFVRVRHRLRIKAMIIVAACLIGILFIFVRVRHHLLTVDNYFINIEDVEEAHNMVASEFIIGESTKTDVENALNDEIFGELDCSHHDEDEFRTDDSDSQIYCDALASYDIFIPRFYLVIWRFSGDVLVDIRVQVTYPGAS